MAAVTLTLTAEAAADIAADFIVSDGTLAARCAKIGALGGMDAKAEGGASGAKIFAAIDAHYAAGTRPVGLSSASVDNALGAYRMAHRMLTAAAAPKAYAAVLTAVHAARIAPLEEAWAEAVKSAKVPAGTRGDAKRMELIDAAVKAVANAKARAAEAAKAAKAEAAAKAAAAKAEAEAEAAKAAAEAAEGAADEAAADEAEAAEADMSAAAVAARAEARMVADIDAIAAAIECLTAEGAGRVAAAAFALATLAADYAASFAAVTA